MAGFGRAWGVSADLLEDGQTVLNRGSKEIRTNLKHVVKHNSIRNPGMKQLRVEPILLPHLEV